MARYGLSSANRYGIDKLYEDDKQRVPWSNTGKGIGSGFRDGWNMANTVKDAYQESEATKAGTEASAETSYGSVAKGLEDPDDPRFKDATPEQRQQAAGLYREAADKGEKYFLSGDQEGRDKPATVADKRTARYGAMANYYRSTGNAKKAEMWEDRHEQLKERALIRGGLERAAAKEIGQDEADKRVSDLVLKLQLEEPGSLAAEKISAEINGVVTGAYGAVKGAQYQASAFALAEGRRKAAVAKSEDDWFTAAKSEDAALKEYNDRFRDGSSAEVEVRNGMRVLVKVDPDGKKTPLGQPYRSWEQGGRQQILGHIPTLAKEGYKLEIAHGFKMREIGAERGKLVAYAKALSNAKEVKVSPELKSKMDAALKEVEAASDPVTGDPKRYEAARHRYNAVVRRIAVDNKNFGLLMQDKAPKTLTAPSLGDVTEARTAVLAQLENDPAFRAMPPAERERKVNSEILKLMKIRANFDLDATEVAGTKEGSSTLAGRERDTTTLGGSPAPPTPVKGLSGRVLKAPAGVLDGASSLLGLAQQGVSGYMESANLRAAVGQFRYALSRDEAVSPDVATKLLAAEASGQVKLSADEKRVLRDLQKLRR